MELPLLVILDLKLSAPRQLPLHRASANKLQRNITRCQARRNNKQYKSKESDGKPVVTHLIYLFLRSNEKFPHHRSQVYQSSPLNFTYV